MEFISNEITNFPSNEVFKVVETTKEWFYHFYECMPPIDVQKGALNHVFMVGEPSDRMEHCDKYVPVFLMCLRKADRFFAVEMPFNFTAAEYEGVLKQICA